jgi:hypothetical protein
VKRDGLLVPKDALVLGDPSPIVFVVDAAAPRDAGGSKDAGGGAAKGSAGSSAKVGKARPVSVRMGASDGRLIEITGAIKAGDMVVVRGNERLRPGQDVVITETLDPRAIPRARAVGR